MGRNRLAGDIEENGERLWIQRFKNSFALNFGAFVPSRFLDLDDVAFNKMRKALQVFFLKRLPMFVSGLTDPNESKFHKRFSRQRDDQHNGYPYQLCIGA